MTCSRSSLTGAVLLAFVAPVFSTEQSGFRGSQCEGKDCAAGQEEADDVLNLLAINRIPGQLSEASSRSTSGGNEDSAVIKALGEGEDNKHLRPAVDNAGTNINLNYTYKFSTDCYTHNFTCPEGSWCQVSARENWYPWDVSYMNRGRCLQYAPKYGACEEAFGGETSFPRKADGSFFERPVYCGPERVCTGEGFSKVLPPMCVDKRDPRSGCFSNRPFCAGRSPGDGETAEEQLEHGDCYPVETDFCVCPKGSTTDAKQETSCQASSTVTKEKLEQCGSVFNSFNGPNFALRFQGLNRTISGQGLPNDANIPAGEHRMINKVVMKHGMNSEMANNILRTLWPYNVCDDSQGGVPDQCKRLGTVFPLRVLERDSDGGLVGTYMDGTNATWVPEMGNGVVDYHCSWMILHTLSFNGPQLLTAEEVKAFGELLMYVSGQFSCKVCRNNFVHIIEAFGLPKGNIRETYARWLVQAHNIANEHTYATHSPSSQMILDSKGAWSTDNRRMDMWAAPDYLHPWWMTFEDALELWTLIPQ